MVIHRTEAVPLQPVDLVGLAKEVLGLGASVAWLRSERAVAAVPV
jgi:hypothetical protein